MKDLINSFFSFDKLMKEKLILPFFWLAVIAWGLDFFDTALSTISLGPLAAIVSFIKFFVTILLALVFIRLICELSMAVFRINDNLSPDGGKSETANIDPMIEARKVAEAAAERAREAAKTAGEKTQAATKSARESIGAKTHAATNRNSEIMDDKTAKAPPSRNTAPKNPVSKSERVKPASNVAASKSTGAKSTTRKAVSRKAATKSNSTAAKRGPKPGVKVRRDAQGRLLKKDGTLRAKPGPKK